MNRAILAFFVTMILALLIGIFIENSILISTAIVGCIVSATLMIVQIIIERKKVKTIMDE